MSYFNTTHEPKNQVKIFAKANAKQDEKVLSIIKNINGKFSSSLVWKKFIHVYFIEKGSPLTSIRRSITTLKQAGLIQETGNRVEGMYGRSELEYILSKN